MSQKQPSQPDLFSVFYNTIELTPDEHAKAIAAAADQDQAVLLVMRHLGRATPSQVHLRFPPSTPITSIRRAMNTLTTAGKLLKTRDKKVGPYGKPEHFWTVA